MNRDALQARIKAIQILCAGLISGLVIVTGILVYLKTGHVVKVPINLPASFPLWAIPVGLLPVGLILVGFLRSTIRAQGIRNLSTSGSHSGRDPVVNATPQDRSSQIVGILTSELIIGNAVMEGIGMMGAVIYFLEGNPLALIAPGFSVFWMMIQFPNTDRLQQHSEAIERQIDHG